MEDISKELLQEQKKTNELLEDLIAKTNGKDPYELLTIDDIVKEFDIGKGKAQKMFQDPELPVQRYTKPFKVIRKAVNKYFEKNRDYLCV